MFDARLGAAVRAAVVDRGALSDGMRVAGPAVVTERETTTVIPSSFDAVVQSDGCLLLRARPKPPGAGP